MKASNGIYTVFNSAFIANIEVFAIGVGNVITPDTLQEVVRDPAKQAFHLKDFAEFDELSLYVRGGK